VVEVGGGQRQRKVERKRLGGLLLLDAATALMLVY